MAPQKVLDERTLEVLWVIAENGHATEKVIMQSLRKHGTPMRNRHDLYRCLKRLQQEDLVAYEEDFGEYVLCRKRVYQRRDDEKNHYNRILHLWDRIKDTHELHRIGIRP